MPRPAVAPVEYFTVPQIQKQFLPLCRQSLQKMFIGQPGVVVVGRRENRDPRKVEATKAAAIAEIENDATLAPEKKRSRIEKLTVPLRKHRKLYVPRVVVERVLREITVTK